MEILIAEIMRRKLLLCRQMTLTVLQCTRYISIPPDNVRSAGLSESQVHEVFPGAVVMPTLAQNMCANF